MKSTPQPAFFQYRFYQELRTLGFFDWKVAARRSVKRSSRGALVFSAYHAQYIAIIIGPENGPRGPGKRFRVLGDFIAGQRKGIARKQDPFGLREGAGGKKRIDP